MAERIDTKTHKIMSMDEDKRQRLLNAAMQEFCKGFKGASTDEIVRAAGISKGLLFHYFGTKESLYHYIIWYAFDIVMEEFFLLINTEQADLLDHLWQIALLKRDLTYRYPAIFAFLTAAYLNAKDDPDDQFAGTLGQMQEDVFSKVYGSFDRTLFKEGIDPQRVSNIVRWTLTGYADTIVTEGKSLEEYQADYDLYLSETRAYFDLFRSVFYR